MKHEFRLFLTAVLFYTRLPVGGWVGHHPHYLHQATRYLPAIGWLVGSVSAFTFLGTAYLFSSSLGILFSMIASILVTGAFHEDGFADVCDGFGGGWTKEAILEIMKDSRLGTYGVVGLILMLAVKYFSLLQLADFSQKQPPVLVLLFIVAHTLSRYTAATFIFTHPYVRFSQDSKVEPVTLVAGKYNFILATVLAFIPLLALVFLADKPLLLTVLLPLYLLRWYLGRYFTKWIGGYTGDCLGATQQVCEVIIYLIIILLWKFT
jgi:adenosylcobinamide-GDP ribazoletransferase